MVSTWSPYSKIRLLGLGVPYMDSLQVLFDLLEKLHAALSIPLCEAILKRYILIEPWALKKPYTRCLRWFAIGNHELLVINCWTVQLDSFGQVPQRCLEKIKGSPRWCQLSLSSFVQADASILRKLSRTMYAYSYTEIWKPMDSMDRNTDIHTYTHKYVFTHKNTYIDIMIHIQI